MAKIVNMRGLQLFISDIRASQNKEVEQKRVEKELAKIREKFGSGKQLTTYDRKKYVWKLLYIYMLGYDVEFGHRQAADLIPEEKFADKQVGYAACSILLNETDEFIRIAINSIRNDLLSRNEAFQCLALSFIGNVGGQEMAEALSQDVIKILTSGTARPVVRKKAALALLRLFRKMPLDADIIQPTTWSSHMSALLDETDIGLLIAIATLLLGIISRTSHNGYEGCHPKLVKILARLVIDKDVSQQYTYYGIPSPWLQIKCLRLLQYFPASEDPAIISTLTDILGQIIKGVNVIKNINKSNAVHAIVFESIALCLHLDLDKELLSQSVTLLGKFITMTDPNIKYMALENLSRLALVPEIPEVIKRHQKTIISALKDADVSIRKRALDLLFMMCDSSNSVEIVNELMTYLTTADFSIREELVLKIAILAERFAPDVKWYVDVAMDLIAKAGEFASDDIWQRVIQLVTNNESMRDYAANKVIESLKSGYSHEALVSVAAYILGEYGSLIKSKVSPNEQFTLLNQKFPSLTTKTKGLLLSSYLKILMIEPNDNQLKQSIIVVYERYSKVADAELQQRAIEYMTLAKQPPNIALQYIQPMPKWETKESSLLRRLTGIDGEMMDNVNDDMNISQLNEKQETSMLTVATPDIKDKGHDDILDISDEFNTSTTTTIQPQSNGAIDSSSLHHSNPLHTTTSNDIEITRKNNEISTPSIDATGDGGNNIDPLSDLLDPTSVVSSSHVNHHGPQEQQNAIDPFSASLDQHAMVGGETPPPVTIEGDLEEWFKELITKEKGILYEDNNLQVGLHSQYNGKRGLVRFFFGNKNTTDIIEKFICMVPPTPNFNMNLGSVPGEIQPKVQVQFQLSVECLQPFLESPTMQMSYHISSDTKIRINQPLKLPITTTKFLQPLPDISQEQFFETWRQFPGPPHKLQEFVTTPVPVPPVAVEGLLQALNFGCKPMALDAIEDNAVGAALFKFGNGAEEQSLLCQVRIEGNPQGRKQFRVTVCSPNVHLTSTLKDTIMQQLGGLH